MGRFCHFQFLCLSSLSTQCVFHMSKLKERETYIALKIFQVEVKNHTFYITVFVEVQFLKMFKWLGKASNMLVNLLNNLLNFIVFYLWKEKKSIHFIFPYYLKNTLLVSISWKYPVHKMGIHLCGFIITHCASSP